MTIPNVEQLDDQDPLAHFVGEFVKTDPDLCYLDGNSLGRLPKKTIEDLNTFLLDEWGSQLVAGWNSWVNQAEKIGNLIGRTALGAAAGQVLACDTTTVNLYQLASAAVRARPGRKTIIVDAANFPTDRYVLQGIAREYGLRLVTIDNENPSLSQHEFISPELLEKYLSDDVALVSLQVVQYRSGAKQNIKEINKLVKQYGAMMLWDAAHAIGSVDLQFDRDEVEIAVGCTYKYGNSGPGAPAWLYVSHQAQHELNVPIQGWFAQQDQFLMGPNFSREQNIRGFQIASPSLLGLRCVETAFEMIGQAGMSEISRKCQLGTSLMIDLYDEWLEPLGFTLNTPRDPQMRGGHISLVHADAELISIALRERKNVIPDYRTPDSIRVAMSPLTNTYQEIFEGFSRIRDLVEENTYHDVSLPSTGVR